MNSNYKYYTPKLNKMLENAAYGKLFLSVFNHPSFYLEFGFHVN